MKKSFLSILLVLSLISINFISCGNNNAQKYYDKAQEVIGDKFISGQLNGETLQEVEKYLDLSIEADKSFWKAYWQKIQIYKADSNYEKIVAVYDNWINNGNEMDAWKMFSYGCTVYSTGNKEKAMNIFNQIYDENKDKIGDKNFIKKEDSYVATMFSGIITEKITDIPEAKDFIIKDDFNASNEAFMDLSEDEKLNILFNDFLNRCKENKDEMITCYAGA